MYGGGQRLRRENGQQLEISEHRITGRKMMQQSLASSVHLRPLHTQNQKKRKKKQKKKKKNCHADIVGDGRKPCMVEFGFFGFLGFSVFATPRTFHVAVCFFGSCGFYGFRHSAHISCGSLFFFVFATPHTLHVAVFWFLCFETQGAKTQRSQRCFPLY